MNRKKDGFSFFLALGFIAFLAMQMVYPVPAARAAEDKKDLPARKISVAPEYTGVIVPKGESVSIDLNVTNGGRQDEYINVALPSVPKGWKARVKTYSFDVTGVYVKSDSTKGLTLKAEPAEGTGPGTYTFSVKGQTQDGQLNSSSQVTVTVIEAEKEKKAKGVNINTSYPVLQGPTDAKFEFSIEVENKTEKDNIFNLIAQGPKNWEINFKPAYEEKYFSSLRIKADRSESMAVEVKPYALAEPGEYPIKVKVRSEGAEGEVDLKVVLTGTFKLDVGTPTGLLSLNAFQGEPANLSFYVKNSGSATQNEVKFLSFKPENWKVEFKPERLEAVPSGELKQVEVTITPAREALVGDYSVNLSANAGKVTKNMELRVTVKASTAWGWVGIGIIILVIAGLVVLFVRMGRR
ncbi:MAG: NEW3 domain-containing protein [Pseudomonadota bacterium]